MTAHEVLERMNARADPDGRAGQARFGIMVDSALGIRVPVLRALARELGRDHTLAAELWASGVHEARILASMVDEPDLVTGEQMEAWAAEFDSWDLVDQCCGNLFDKTPLAWTKAAEWAYRDEEFVRRAGFALMAWLAVHDKRAPDSKFEGFFGLIEVASDDGRNFVKKAVNWALRQIGKRSAALNRQAIAVAQDLKGRESTSARWIGSDALRELTSEAVAARLARSTSA